MAVPLVLFWAIQDKQKPLKPKEIRGLVLTINSEVANFDKASNNWQLLLSWYLLASQQDANGTSLLGLPVDAVTEGDDNYFKKWIDQRLNAVFRPHPNLPPPGTAELWGSTHPQTAPSQVSALMATKVGKRVALGLREMGHLQQDPSQLGGGGPKTTSQPSWGLLGRTVVGTYLIFENSLTPQKEST